MPDCYWEQEGFSNLASAIGRPVFVDEFTSRLEILQFAKICVEYTFGKDLPTKINVLELNPVTEETSIATVTVSYPSKPRFCYSCLALAI